MTLTSLGLLIDPVARMGSLGNFIDNTVAPERSTSVSPEVPALASENLKVPKLLKVVVGARSTTHSTVFPWATFEESDGEKSFENCLPLVSFSIRSEAMSSQPLELIAMFNTRRVRALV